MAAFHFLAQRVNGRVRLLTRKGNNFASRFPQIVAAVTLLPVQSCLIDGEAIVCNGDGLAMFDLVREYRHDSAAVLCAFDLLEVDGEDLRRIPIEQRKGVFSRSSARGTRRRSTGPNSTIFFVETAWEKCSRLICNFVRSCWDRRRLGFAAGLASA
jgi:ATP-dependent DNA ligase